MTHNLFDNAKFGDIFFTTENKQAVFLRFSENAEYKFAILYVEGWGNVQVFRHNGKEIYNDAAHSIISKQEEPVSEELEEEIGNYVKRNGYDGLDSIEEVKYIANHFAQWQKEQDQSTIELAEDHAMLAGMEKMKEEMMKNIWKPADGEDLPEIDREVIVFTQPYPLEGNEYAVSFAHRPDPKGWDAKSIITEKVEHYTPETYDKGGWNQPNVKWWLDVDKLPNMEG